MAMSDSNIMQETPFLGRGDGSTQVSSPGGVYGPACANGEGSFLGLQHKNQFLKYNFPGNFGGLQEEKRGTGITSRQIKAAPEKSIYVWPCSNFSYPRKLAFELGRKDLKIISIHDLVYVRWMACCYPDIILDHATYRVLTCDQFECYEMIKSRSEFYKKSLSPVSSVECDE